MLEHERSAADSAAVGRRRQRQHLRAQQAAGARRDLRAERAVAARGALRLVEHARAARTRPALGASRHASASPGCRPTRASPAACRRRASRGYSALGRQATNPQWQYPTRVEPEGQLHVADGPPVVQGGLRVPAHQRRGAGREPALRPRHLHRPVHAAGRRGGEQPLQPRRLHARPALAVRAQHVLRRRDAAEHALHLPAGRHPRERQADAQRRPALRVRDADVGSEQRPHELRSGHASRWSRRRTDRSPTARSSIPIGTTSRRGSASRTRRRPKTVVRGGWGIELRALWTASDRRTCSAINGPQVVRAVVNQTTRPPPSFLPTEQGYPAEPHRSVDVQPADRAHQLHPAATIHSSPVQSWYVSVQREFGAQHAASTSPTSATRRTTCCWSATTTRRRRTTPPARIPLAARRPIPTFGDITYVFNGGKSRYDALQMKYEWRHGRRRHAAQLADAVEGEGQRAPARSRTRTATSRRRRTSTTSTPTTALSGYHQPYNSTTSFVWTLPFGRGKRWGSSMSPALDVLVGGWQVAGINTVTPGEMVTFTYTPGGGVPGVGHHERLLGREQLPAERDLRSVRRRASSRSPTGSTPPACRFRPIRASRSATRRATTCAGRTSGSSISRRASTCALGGRREAAVPARGVQSVQPRELHGAQRQPQHEQLRHDHVDLRSAADAARSEGAVVTPTEVVSALTDLHTSRDVVHSCERLLPSSEDAPGMHA